ncbi:hypothetical protein [Terrihabitans sp. B22-R8]|uniref:hypothetical protein n=1 Tax=Terrihabitans sp. B22-R8 TaxID=3425128 RepID=UPI00403D3809
MLQAQITPSNPVVVRMAAFMQNRAAASGCCTEQDLRDAGYDDDEVRILSASAARFARHQSERQLADMARLTAPAAPDPRYEPKPGQYEPPPFALTEGSRELYVRAMLSTLRAMPCRPASLRIAREHLARQGHAPETIAACADEAFTRLHGHAVNAYELPLAGGVR